MDGSCEGRNALVEPRVAPDLRLAGDVTCRREKSGDGQACRVGPLLQYPWPGLARLNLSAPSPQPLLEHHLRVGVTMSTV
jgi:hypothetical protein